MSEQSVALAVLVRSMQWELEEAAYKIGGSRYSEQQRRHLADQLDALAHALRTIELHPTA
ncbi:hypothetical protein AB8O55_07120 [Saccharopolyspora cebuensis]|uniref:Uncharacterized protein n=1 Tax=Saccharopolyspora cebuensis TaxID=418759 RepID=A0ABV4CEG7_9PSEU